MHSGFGSPDEIPPWAYPAQHLTRLSATLQPRTQHIEILWKQAKYHGREFVTWPKDTFRFEVAALLDGFGTKFQINFN
jgi:hypothetical protein